MNSRIVYSILALAAVALIGFLAISKPKEAPRVGVAHEDHGREHVETKTYGGEEPPTSGDHANALPWGVYQDEVDDVNTIHNLEHGGVYISYRPDVPPEHIERIKALFFEPYVKKDFKPTKVVMAPRAKNKAPIIISSWLRSQSFEQYNEQAMIEYYKSNAGKSPEPLAS